jgi:hypothetical protein
VKLVICCALWGDWHLRVFREKSLPTILHPSNLPAMAERIEVEWLFYTPHHDKRAAEFVPKMCVPSQVVSLNLQLGYKTAWAFAKYEAAKRGALVMFLAPDIVWSIGSFNHLTDILEDGKTTVFMSHPRGVEEHFCGHPKTGEELMEQCRKFPHPVNDSEVITNRPFTKHPEMILWPVKGGWLCRMFAREPLIAHPDTAFTAKNLIESMPDVNIGVVASSDDACGVSLAPSDTEQHHYKHGNVFRPEAMKPFVEHHWSECGEFVASKPVLWRYGEVCPKSLLTATKQSQQLVKEAFA